LHQLLISGGVELIAGGGRETLESLALRHYYPKDNLLQRLLNLMAEPVNEVYIYYLRCCEFPGRLVAAAAAAMKFFHHARSALY
jgi:hypothetical protein